jgi:hypothetical protein
LDEEEDALREVLPSETRYNVEATETMVGKGGVCCP